MRLSRIAAFTCDGRGGNPAGVVLLDAPAAEADMRRVARDVGYSETAFLHPDGGGWKIRYFSPEIEVPFCGHATIAAGAVLGSALGEGVHALTLRDGTDVTVEQGHAAARVATINALAAANTLLGGLEGCRVIRTVGMVACAPEFIDHPQVVNGASELLRDVFGEERGIGTRLAYGVAALPLNAPVEVELLLEVS